MSILLMSIIIWCALGFWGTYIIIKSEVDFDKGYWSNATYFELLATLKWILLGPITLFLIIKWMFEEEGLGDKKVFDKDSNDKK